ncbi:U3 small nucleolar ribonucleoprotein imp3 [Entomophthora muscae]|uniref:U3 small nucleolar ribonucleoprotein imp3 n=1 Tax=Entomophthora muscae TaxID=34485 RepID=A0ACC2S3W4_9FUNG|nr:U3 small nucleolar ribonucleoprotein imp3 [Entomophthora muscae]
MTRKLKHHEQKLLKKVDFLQWKSTNNVREIEVVRRYLIQNREDYTKYNKLCGQIHKVANKIALLHDRDPFRREKEVALLNKIYDMGLIASKSSFSEIDKLNVSSFCRRRLPIVMCRLKNGRECKRSSSAD